MCRRWPGATSAGRRALRVDDESTKDQSLGGYPEDDKRQYRSDGNISKTYDPVALSKRPMAQGHTLITVN